MWLESHLQQLLTVSQGACRKASRWLTHSFARWQESMRIKPVVATGTIRIARTKATTLDNGRLHIPAMCSLWTPSHTMHNSSHNWGADARQYKPVRRPSLFFPLCLQSSDVMIAASLLFQSLHALMLSDAAYSLGRLCSLLVIPLDPCSF